MGLRTVSRWGYVPNPIFYQENQRDDDDRQVYEIHPSDLVGDRQDSQERKHSKREEISNSNPFPQQDDQDDQHTGASECQDPHDPSNRDLIREGRMKIKHNQRGKPKPYQRIQCQK
jgi:hypothetical protein